MPAPTASALPLPTAIIFPIVEGVAEAYKTPITFVMVHTIFGAMLVPMLVATFVFSTSKIRRTPIFIGVVGSMCLGLILATINDYIMIHAMLSPLKPESTPLRYAFTWISFSMSWMIDLVLVLRLLAVYPRATTPRLRWCIIMFVPFALKSARLGCIVAFFVDFVRNSPNSEEKWQSSLADGNSLSIYRSHYFQALWILQMIDNGFIAGMFLWRLRKSLGLQLNIGGNASETKTSFFNRLRILFWIALTNFLFPVTLNIVQMAVVFSSPFWVIAYLENVNSYISIMGLVFATIWGSASSQELQSRSPLSSDHSRPSRVRSRMDQIFLPPKMISTPSKSDEDPIADVPRWGDADSRDNSLHTEGDRVGLQVRIDQTRQSNTA